MVVEHTQSPPLGQKPSGTSSATDLSLTTDSKNPSLALPVEKDPGTEADNGNTIVDDEKQRDVGEDSKEVADGDPELEYPKAGTLAFILLALAMSIFLVSLDMTIIATAIPRITDEFHSLDDVGWYGTAFFLTLAR
jgi:hypothetical protein